MEYINLKAYGKINLGLDVIGTLDNGYHQVRMIMQSVDIFDKVNIYKAPGRGIRMKTNLSYLPSGPDNLVYKAAALIKEKYGIADGMDIDLYKFIPVSAGMAGGSSDAAAVLKGVNELWNIGASENELMELGAKLGADIPYCVMGGTALAEGIGEKLTRLPDCPECTVVIGKPNLRISTRYVYEKLVLDENTVHPDIDGMMEAIKNSDIKGVASRLCNVLETVTETENPVISQIKKFMVDNGALGALMSGSGPTVFGLFESGDEATRCNEMLKKSGLVRNSYTAHLV